MMEYILVELQAYSVQAATLLWADFTTEFFLNISRKQAVFKKIF